jgi:hypothetical protein
MCEWCGKDVELIPMESGVMPMVCPECGTGCGHFGYKGLRDALKNKTETHCDKMMKDPEFVRESLRSDLIMEITEAICEVLNSYGLKQNTTDALQCPECQQNHESSMNFCANCGRQLWHQ